MIGFLNNENHNIYFIGSDITPIVCPYEIDLGDGVSIMYDGKAISGIAQDDHVFEVTTVTKTPPSFTPINCYLIADSLIRSFGYNSQATGTLQAGKIYVEGTITLTLPLGFGVVFEFMRDESQDPLIAIHVSRMPNTDSLMAIKAHILRVCEMLSISFELILETLDLQDGHAFDSYLTDLFQRYPNKWDFLEELDNSTGLNGFLYNFQLFIELLDIPQSDKTNLSTIIYNLSVFYKRNITFSL